MKHGLGIAGLLLAVAFVAGAGADGFDHEYSSYAKLLNEHVHVVVVDYTALKEHRDALSKVMADFAEATPDQERGWSRDARLAFWVNAYNLFTLRAIVDHYPIRSSLLTWQPRNSIRQIDGVWTRLTWQAAGRTLTLDDIEHKILRAEFKEPRIHFAINCASISCPVVAPEPYVAARLDQQLDEAARRYLASPEGLRIDRDTLHVSSILRWYGEDFVERFAPMAPEGRRQTEVCQQAWDRPVSDIDINMPPQSQVRNLLPH
jgi:hypothetical protein